MQVMLGWSVDQSAFHLSLVLTLERALVFCLRDGTVINPTLCLKLLDGVLFEYLSYALNRVHTVFNSCGHRNPLVVRVDRDLLACHRQGLLSDHALRADHVLEYILVWVVVLEASTAHVVHWQLNILEMLVRTPGSLTPLEQTLGRGVILLSQPRPLLHGSYLAHNDELPGTVFIVTVHLLPVI